MPGQIYMMGIGRDLVELGDVSPILDFLRSADADRRSLREHFESLDMVFEGYDDDPREVYQIPEVRAFVAVSQAGSVDSCTSAPLPSVERLKASSPVAASAPRWIRNSGLLQGP